MKCGLCLTIASMVLCSAALLNSPAAANDVSDFYKGKTISLVIGHQAGSGFDVYARAFAPHFSRHIPGNPNIVVKNMIGASGMIAANWLYNIAPRDGTAIANFSVNVTLDPLLGSAAAKYDPAKFTWIGNMDESIGICGVSKASGISKFEDLFTTETLFGATGEAGPFGKFPNAIKNLLGAKIKVIPGYKGSASVRIAIQRGEVHGICGLPYTTFKSFWRDEYETGALNIIVRLSGKANPELKNVPHINDFAKSAEDRQVFNFIFGVNVLGRIYSAPPQIPTDRRDALRAAFASAVADPLFLADAKKARIDINPGSGQEVEEFITGMTTSSPAVIRRAREALRHN